MVPIEMDIDIGPQVCLRGDPYSLFRVQHDSKYSRIESLMICHIYSIILPHHITIFDSVLSIFGWGKNYAMNREDCMMCAGVLEQKAEFQLGVAISMCLKLGLSKY